MVSLSSTRKSSNVSESISFESSSTTAYEDVGSFDKNLVNLDCCLCMERLSCLIENEFLVELSCGDFCHSQCFQLMLPKINTFSTSDNAVEDKATSSLRCPSCKQITTCANLQIHESLMLEKFCADIKENAKIQPSKIEYLDFDVTLDSPIPNSKNQLRKSLIQDSSCPNIKMHINPKPQNDGYRCIMEVSTPFAEKEKSLDFAATQNVTQFVKNYTSNIGNILIFDYLIVEVNGFKCGECLCFLSDTIFLVLENESSILLELDVSDLSKKVLFLNNSLTILSSNCFFPEIQVFSSWNVLIRWKEKIESLDNEISDKNLSLTSFTSTARSLCEVSNSENVQTQDQTSAIEANVVLCLSLINNTKHNNQIYKKKLQYIIENFKKSLRKNDKLGVVFIGKNSNGKPCKSASYTGCTKQDWDGWDIIFQDIEVHSAPIFEDNCEEVLMGLKSCLELFKLNQQSNRFQSKTNTIFFVSGTELSHENGKCEKKIVNVIQKIKHLASLHFIYYGDELQTSTISSLESKLNDDLNPNLNEEVNQCLLDNTVSEFTFGSVKHHILQSVEGLSTEFFKSLFHNIYIPLLEIVLESNAISQSSDELYDEVKSNHLKLTFHDLPHAYNKSIAIDLPKTQTAIQYDIKWLNSYSQEIIQFPSSQFD